MEHVAFVIARKFKTFNDIEDPIHYEYWGSDGWTDNYSDRRYYPTKEEALIVAESIATSCFHTYRVLEEGEAGFVLNEYEV